MLLQANYFAHETTIIDHPVTIGNGTRIWHYTHVMSGAVIGADCTIGQSVFIGSRARIGNGVKIQNNVSVYDEVTLEDYVFCGPSMVFTNDLTPRAKYPKQGIYLPTRVGYGASLGANCTIVCGHTIGAWAMVGAGTVVTRDVPDYAIVVGNPARLQGWACECGTRLDFGNNQADCKTCSRNYIKRNEKLVSLNPLWRGVPR